MSSLDWIGRTLARHLTTQGQQPTPPATTTPDRLAATLRRGDVLLVEGSSRISTAIKYLTQSTWSHAALCTQTPLDARGQPVTGDCLLEADVTEGVRRVPLNLYWDQHTRICRPAGLSEVEISAIIEHAEARLGHQYDLRNIFDLARYLLRTPPVPSHHRRRLLALGSGDPTRAICSSLIAQAFQSVRYPILPHRETVSSARHPPRTETPLTFDSRRSRHSRALSQQEREVLHIRHHSLFAPRDFDISPYFEIIKPTLCAGFDPHLLQWGEPPT